MLIIALDYEYSPAAELTCTKDARTMYRMAGRAGVDDVTILTDKAGVGAPSFPTRSFVLRHLRQVAKRCEPGDWFVWFWAGHGVNVPDFNGDEKDGFDQAFVTPDTNGKLTESALLIDDEFAMALDTFVPEGVRILCINDCCHSGTICDIDSFMYTHDIYSISAALDHEEAEDVGEGGVLSCALRRAVRTLSVEHGRKEFSIQAVFKRCKAFAKRLTKEQHVTLQYHGTDPSLVAWPLGYPWWIYIKKAHVMTVNIQDLAENGLDSDEEWSPVIQAPQNPHPQMSGVSPFGLGAGTPVHGAGFPAQGVGLGQMAYPGSTPYARA
ncbi:unnamed protein product [Effrenium voratum]|nr:unnamed protein product [Effrenium voratum]